MRFIKKSMRLCLALICAISLGLSFVSVQDVQAAKIRLNKTKVTIRVGKSAQLKVRHTKKKVRWYSSNKRIVYVNRWGRITGKKAGKATIIAKVKGKKLKCRVTVKKAIKLSSNKLTLYQGTSHKLKLLNTSASVKWSTSKKKVVKVSKGNVTAVKSGTATVTALSGKTKYKCAVTVYGPCKLNKTSMTLGQGQTEKLSMSGTIKSTKWYSSDTSVVSVSSKGIVTAKSAGDAVITAKSGSHSKTCSVKVISLSSTGIILAKGNQSTLTLNNASSATWSSSDKSVASVSNGVITANKAGSATITAMVGETKLTCQISVISFEHDHMTLEKGITYMLDINAGDHDVEWVSEDPSVVSVNDGEFKAEGIGTTKVTATIGDQEISCEVNVVALSHNKLTIMKGKSKTLVVKGIDDTNTGITWTSNNEESITVDDGVISAAGSGVAYITATVNGLDLQAEVHVYDQGETIYIGQNQYTDIVSDEETEWSSEDESIASINNEGTLIGITPGNTTIMNKDTHYNVSVVGLDRTEMSIPAGGQDQLNVLNMNGSESFSSSDEDVLTVSDTGDISAKAPGKAKITVSYKGVKLTCQVNVYATLSVEDTDIYVQKGKKVKLNITGPDDYKRKDGNSKIAHLTSYNNVQGKELGETTVTVYTEYESIDIKVTVIPVVAFDEPELRLSTSASYTLTLPKFDEEVEWSSSNTNIATVNKGVVKAQNSAGTCNIIAEVYGYKAKCKVTVKKNTVSLSSKNRKATIWSKVGTTQYVSSILKKGVSVKSPKFKTDNEAVCQVTQDSGLIMPISAGTCHIYMTGASKTYYILLKVHDPHNVRIGMDISCWQGKNVDMEKMKDNEVDYLIFRAGHGMLKYSTTNSKGVDLMFSTYRKKAEAAGYKDYGVYWYLESGSSSRKMSEKDARTQAKTLVSVVGTSERKIYLDLEGTGIFKGVTGRSAIGKYLKKITKAFVDELIDQGIKKENIAIYANKNWYENYLYNSYFNDFEIYWHARYGVAMTRPTFTVYKTTVHPDIWQCGCTFKTNAISNSYVDMNYIYD